MTDTEERDSPRGWLEDRELREKLRAATVLMLDAMADVIEDEGLTLSAVLQSGAEFACSHADLPDRYAPLVEAEAVGYLARTLARVPQSLFTGQLMVYVRKIDSLAQPQQVKLLRRAAAAYTRRLPASAAAPEPADAPTVPYVVGRYQGGPYVAFAALTRHPAARRPAR
ncbi:hypothetical protein [Streptacidiphilus fuscans]|uniref:Uncharacterized protein n=1 Tax=Streptacidiphilus fuscans TaxID=2789292 RepID=A0A931B948_9ACTN|nr:hypothetical protein [Streptacidiphilus fuscans]MBF9071782.1 hypothetical protein [Streptacidiphilus fuscans]